MTLISTATVDFVNLSQVAGYDSHLRSDAVAVCRHAAKGGFKPVNIAGGFVSENAWLLARVEYHGVNITVVLQIVQGRPPTGLDWFQTTATTLRDILKMARASVQHHRIRSNLPA